MGYRQKQGETKGTVEFAIKKKADGWEGVKVRTQLDSKGGNHDGQADGLASLSSSVCTLRNKYGHFYNILGYQRKFDSFRGFNRERGILKHCVQLHFQSTARCFAFLISLQQEGGSLHFPAGSTRK